MPEVTVTRETVLPAEPADVWRSLTEPQRLAEWLGAEAEIDLRPGGDLALSHRERRHLRVTESRPLEALAAIASGPSMLAA